MRNIPSVELGLVLVSGDLQTFCEWLVRRAGGIATCVESSEMMVNHVIKGLPVNATEDNALADDLLARGQASANGATNYLAAAAQMTRLGVPNVAYGADWFAAHDFVPVVQDAIRRNMPVLFGLYAAHLLHDTWTNADEDAGVFGHGICIFGYDSTGAICGDPNTAQAENGDFVHYTWADLKAAGGSFPSMVVPLGTRAGGAEMAVTPIWHEPAAGQGTLTYPAHDGVPEIVLDHSQAYYAHDSRLGVFPLLPGFYEGEDSVVLWSDCIKTIAVKSTGWAVHEASEAVDLEAALKAQAQVGALNTQVASLQVELAAAKAAAGNPAEDAAVKALLSDPFVQALLALAKV